jgi:phosphoglycerol transferase MdoB-like AlkP superfamily enzyme
MISLKKTLIDILKLLFFWILLFDFGRVLFTIHNIGKFTEVTFSEWILVFVFSFRLDIATAAALSAPLLLVMVIRFIVSGKWAKHTFLSLLGLEVAIFSLIHCGEINAYTEWNHKLTTRVFMHLANPDEVFKTAGYGMIFWFIFYILIECTVAFFLIRILFMGERLKNDMTLVKRIFTGVLLCLVVLAQFFLMLRGGIQQIPLNIDSAYYSRNHLVNDLSVNSLYFFGKSYLLYNRSEIDEFMPKIDTEEAESIVSEMYNYPKKHTNYIFKNKKPNIVFVVLEGWSSNAIGCLSETKNSTPSFDKLASEGLLFTSIYACASTSEIGNSSIFSGYPALPEISISKHPEKHRKIHTINQVLKGYSSNYLFSGDLKYGNIGGYFMEHGFDHVLDEAIFPSHLPRGILNYYDKDLYDLFLKKINKTKQPFLHCAFTGSTHAPFDQPKLNKPVFTGEECDYMNSLAYSDHCLGSFIENCKKQSWFKNTIFVFVADHGHPSPGLPNPSANIFFRIPFLIWGAPLKDAFKGNRFGKIGSQADIAATLMYQLDKDITKFPWSKDLLNPKSPEFALHTIIRGYGWVSDKGNMIYQMDTKSQLENTYSPKDREPELKKCNAFLTQFYKEFKSL